MAQGKYSRVDGKKSSCSTATIVVVVGVCLVAVWMFMSSSAAPGQTPDLPAATETKQKVTANPSSQFEDNSGDLPDDAVKDEGNQETTQNGGDSNSEESNTNEVETNTNTGDESSSNDEKSNSEDGNANSDSNEGEKSNSSDTDSNESESSNSNNTDSNSDSNETGKTDSEDEKVKPDEKVEKEEEKQTEESSGENKTEDFSAATQSEILKETNTQNGAFSTQAAESASEKESQSPSSSKNYKWKTCNVTAGPDYIPCLDNLEAIRHLHGRSHYEHRERHCPDESPTCLVPLPEGYKTSIKWPRSREQIWYSNVPHTKLAAVKGHQNWVKVTGEYLTFPGGGTQFKNGALHYIDFIKTHFLISHGVKEPE